MMSVCACRCVCETGLIHMFVWPAQFTRALSSLNRNALCLAIDCCMLSIIIYLIVGGKSIVNPFLCVGWFSRGKSLWPGLNALWQAKNWVGQQLGSCNSYGLWISDCQRRRCRRRRQICRCSGVASSWRISHNWQLATGSRQQATGNWSGGSRRSGLGRVNGEAVGRGEERRLLV